MHQDGRLQTGDHILQIENQIVKDMTTSQVAMILKHLGVNVNMTVGRVHRGPLEPQGSKVVVPAQDLEDILTSLNSGGMASASRRSNVHSKVRNF